MAARINIKNMDYFKFKKLVIDGSRDDYDQCSKEIKALCDVVQTLRFRDEEFDLVSDIDRFQEICTYYKQILISKRIDSADMRIKSGWWGDHKNAYSAGKLKPAILRETLLSKAKDWYVRSGTTEDYFQSKIAPHFDGCGLYILKHKDQQCFQQVENASKIFPHAMEKIKQAFDGSNHEPIAALLIVTMFHEWEFYFIPLPEKGGEQLLKIKENDAILKHDSLWPYGLNFCVHNDTYAELIEFRKSCIRHRWPPSIDSPSLDSYDLEKLMSVQIPTTIKSKKKSPVSEDAKDISGEKTAKTKDSSKSLEITNKEDVTDAGQTSEADAKSSPSTIERTSSESSILSIDDTAGKSSTDRGQTSARPASSKTARGVSSADSRPKSASRIRPISGSGRGRGGFEKRKIPVASPGKSH